MSNAERSVDFARLVDWIDGRLSERESRAVENTVVEADDATLADLAWLRKFRAAAGAVPTESPPLDMRERLIETFKVRKEARTEDRRGWGLLERVRGGLAFDSNLQPSAGMRAGGVGQSRRQLIYHADAFDLVLNLLMRGSDNDLDLDGQMLPLEGGEQETFSVQLLRGGDEVAISAVDEMGSFSLRRVPPGSYEMVFSTATAEVSVSPIDVGL